MKKGAEKEELKQARGGTHGSKEFMEIIEEARKGFQLAEGGVEKQQVADELIKKLQSLHF